MLEIILLIGAVAIFAAGSFNPITIARKLWAWINFGIGASPKGVEYIKTKTEEFKVASDLEYKQQGEDITRIGQVYQKKGAHKANQFLNPLIEESKVAKAKKQEALNNML